MTLEEAGLFIEEWYAARTLDEFCKRMELSKREASNLAAYLRRKDIPLPRRRAAEVKGHSAALSSDDVFILRRLADRLAKTAKNS